jgi:hypothetical protein
MSLPTDIVPEKIKCSICRKNFIVTHGFFLELDGELTGAVLMLCSNSCAIAALAAWEITMQVSQEA